MAYKNPGDRAVLEETKVRVAEALTAAGEPFHGREAIQFLVAACERHFGPRRIRESKVEYFARCLEMAPKPAQKYQGEIVKPHVVNLIEQPEWIPPRHPREAEIDALPPIIDVHGIGNGVVWSHVDR